MAARQDEPVTTDPTRVGGIVTEVPLEQQRRRGRQCDRGTGVSGLRAFDGIGGQQAGGGDQCVVDHGGIDVGGGV